MNEFLTLAGGWLPIIVAFLPLVIGLVTKSTAPRSVKSTIMIIVTGLTTLGAQVADGGGILTKEMVTAWAFSIVVAVASYYGIWSPLGAGNIAPDQGIG